MGQREKILRKREATLERQSAAVRRRAPSLSTIPAFGSFTPLESPLLAAGMTVVLFSEHGV